MVSAGLYHSLALTDSGNLVAWGDNSSNQIDLPDELEDVMQVAVGYRHSLALTACGQVIAWGDNDHGQCDVPERLQDVIAIAAGSHHSMALTRSGIVVAWGMNDEGQIHVPNGLIHVIAIAAGDDHSLALTQSGQVVVWGANDVGQCNVPLGVDITHIAAGSGFCAAITQSGYVIAWGDNDQGQCNVPDVIRDNTLTYTSVSTSTALPQKLCPQCIQITYSNAVYCSACGTMLQQISTADAMDGVATNPTQVMTVNSSVHISPSLSSGMLHRDTRSTSTQQGALGSNVCVDTSVAPSLVNTTQAHGVVSQMQKLKFGSRASDIRENSYAAAELYIVMLTIAGIFFLVMTGILIVLLGINTTSSDSGLVRMIGTYAVIPVIFISAIVSFLSFYLRDILKMKVDDSHNIAFMSKRIDDVVQLLAQSQPSNSTNVK